MDNYKRPIGILVGILILLAIPAIAMQFSTEVNWSLVDFMVMAILLVGTAFMVELIFRKSKSRYSKLFLLLFLLITFVLIWAELAVGLFGTPFAGS